MAGGLGENVARYRDWLSAHAAPLAKQLRPGLSERQICDAIQKADMPLPADCFPLFEQFDGQRSQKACLLPCPMHRWNGLRLASLEYMESWRDASVGSEWLYKHGGHERKVQVTVGVRDAFWRNGWLPFADGETVFPKERKAVHAYLYLDFEPAKKGKVGQVVYQTIEREVHQQGMGAESVTRNVVAASLADYFGDTVAALERGKAGYAPDKGIVWL